MHCRCVWTMTMHTLWCTATLHTMHALFYCINNFIPSTFSNLIHWFCFIVHKPSTQVHMCGGTLSIGPCTSQDSHGMNAIMIAQPLPIPSFIPFNRLSCSANATTCNVSLLPYLQLLAILSLCTLRTLHLCSTAVSCCIHLSSLSSNIS